jgi:HAD superfamily hydrolase (TIGR01459 family)
MVQVISGLDRIADRYQVFFVDVWGVLYDGYQPYPNTIDTLEQLQKQGKGVFLLSNAPRPSQSLQITLRDVGITSNLYQKIYTSGDECLQHLQDRSNPFYAKLGKKFYHIGPDQNRSLFENLSSYTEVKDVEEASFILVTGSSTCPQDVEVFKSVLRTGLNRFLPLVCANADQNVLIGDKLIVCAGTIAKEYRRAGGEVFMHGKPYRSMFQNSFEDIQKISGKKIHVNRIVMIGDSLRTDIRGANHFGIDSVWIGNGIHRKELTQQSLRDVTYAYRSWPRYFLEVFQFDSPILEDPIYNQPGPDASVSHNFQ